MTAWEGIGDINATVQSVQDWTATDWIIAFASVWLLSTLLKSGKSEPRDTKYRDYDDRHERRRSRNPRRRREKSPDQLEHERLIDRYADVRSTISMMEREGEIVPDSMWKELDDLKRRGYG